MRAAVRLGFLAITIGLSITLLAFAGWSYHLYGPPEGVKYGNYFGYAFGSCGAFQITATAETEERFSLYVLSFNDTLTLIETQSLDGIEPLLQVEGVIYYNRIVTEYPPGRYGVIVRPYGNYTAYPVIEIIPVHPFPEILTAGISISIVGLFVMVVSAAASRFRNSRVR